MQEKCEYKQLYKSILSDCLNIVTVNDYRIVKKKNQIKPPPKKTAKNYQTLPMTWNQTRYAGFKEILARMIFIVYCWFLDMFKMNTEDL